MKELTCSFFEIHLFVVADSIGLHGFIYLKYSSYLYVFCDVILVVIILILRCLEIPIIQ